MRRIIFIILSLAMMITIFCFSAKDADESTNTSLKVGIAIGRIIVPGFEQLDKEEQISYAERIDHTVRKSAHFIEYTVLGMLLLGIFYPKIGNNTFDLRNALSTFLPPFGIGALYAASDEIHQGFVPGRSCQLSDVLLDSSGGLTGVILGTLVAVVISKLYKIRNKNQHSDAEKSLS